MISRLVMPSKGFEEVELIGRVTSVYMVIKYDSSRNIRQLLINIKEKLPPIPALTQQ
jgi:hypothetical protein